MFSEPEKPAKNEAEKIEHAEQIAVHTQLSTAAATVDEPLEATQVIETLVAMEPDSPPSRAFEDPELGNNASMEDSNVLRETFAKLEQSNAALTAELTEQKEHMSRYMQSAHEIQKQRDDYSRGLSVLQDKVASQGELISKHAVVEEMLYQAKQACDDYLAEITQLQRDRVSMQQNYEELCETHSALRSELNNLAHQNTTKQENASLLEDRNASLSKILQDRDSQIAEAQSRLLMAQRDASMSRKDMQTMEEKWTSLKQSLTEAESSFRAAKEKVKAQEEEIVSTRQKYQTTHMDMQQMQKKEEAMLIKTVQLEAKCKILTEEKQRERTQMETMSAHYSLLEQEWQQQLQDQCEENDSAVAQMKQRDSTVQILKKQLDEQQQKLKKADATQKKLQQKEKERKDAAAVTKTLKTNSESPPSPSPQKEQPSSAKNASSDKRHCKDNIALAPVWWFHTTSVGAAAIVAVIIGCIGLQLVRMAMSSSA